MIMVRTELIYYTKEMENKGHSGALQQACTSIIERCTNGDTHTQAVYLE